MSWKYSGYKEESSKKITVNSQSGYLFSFKGKNGKVEVRKIENISRSEALKIKKSKEIEIRSLFILKPTPYPGEITRKLSCDKKYYPKFSGKNEKDFKSYIEMYSNSRGTIGGCVDKFATHVANVAFIYCSKYKEFFYIKLFTKKNSYTRSYIKMIKSIRCK